MDMIQVQEEAVNGKAIAQLFWLAYDTIKLDDPERADAWMECVLIDISILINKKIFIDKGGE